ncbi:hypothetical protein PAMP_002729 [Pampus punctatissimus]
MDGQARSSSKYLLLQVWCGLLTVAMVAMASLLATFKLKSFEDGVSTMKPDNVSPIVPSVAPLKSIRSSLSYIQLKPEYNRTSAAKNKHFWKVYKPECDSCSLTLHDNYIHCTENSLYFLYAQVTFSKHLTENYSKSVTLIRNATFGKRNKTLVGGTFPYTTEGSVWVAKIVSLDEGDSVSLNISGDFLTEHTFWGAYQLH